MLIDIYYFPLRIPLARRHDTHPPHHVRRDHPLPPPKRQKVLQARKPPLNLLFFSICFGYSFLVYLALFAFLFSQ